MSTSHRHSAGITNTTTRPRAPLELQHRLYSECHAHRRLRSGRLLGGEPAVCMPKPKAWQHKRERVVSALIEEDMGDVMLNGFVELGEGVRGRGERGEARRRVSGLGGCA